MALSPQKQRLVSEGPAAAPIICCPLVATAGISCFSVPHSKQWSLVTHFFVRSTQIHTFTLVLLHAVFRTRKAHFPPLLENLLSPALPNYPLQTTKPRALLPHKLSGLPPLSSLLSSPASDTKLLPRLGELTMTDMTQNSVNLSWTVPEGEFDSFLVQYKDRGGQLQVVPVAADQREVTIPSLEPNRKYKFLLFGLIGRKRLGPASVEGTTG